MVVPGVRLLNVRSVQVTPSVDVKIEPPTATHRPLCHAMPRTHEIVPEEAGVQVTPSGEEVRIPSPPAATQRPAKRVMALRFPSTPEETGFHVSPLSGE